MDNEKCSKKQDTGEVERLGWGARHLQVACMCMCVTVLFIVRSSMGVAILAMTDANRKNESFTIYDWDKSTQGVVLSSFFWGYVTMQIPAGILTKRFGGKPILLIAILANGTVCLLIPMLVSVGGWQIVCAARVVIGLSQACTFPGTHTLLGRWLPDHERVLFSSIVYGGTQMGTILGMPVSGLLAGTSLGWPLLFYAMAALSGCTAALWYWLTASTPAQHPLMTPRELEYIEKSLNTSQVHLATLTPDVTQELHFDPGTRLFLQAAGKPAPRRPSLDGASPTSAADEFAINIIYLGEKRIRTPWAAILKCRAVWALVISHIGVAYGFVMFFVDMPTYLEKGLNISLRNSAILSALPYLGMWAGGIIAAAISEKLSNKGYLSISASRKTFNSIGIVGLSAGLVALGFVGPDNSSYAVVILIFTVSLTGVFSAGYMLNHLDLSPNFAGVLMSLTNFIANIGSGFNPILTSFILQNDPTDVSRWRIVFLVVVGISLSTNLIYVIFGSAEQQPWDDPHFLDKKTADPEEMKPVIEQKEKNEAKS